MFDSFGDRERPRSDRDMPDVLGVTGSDPWRRRACRLPLEDVFALEGCVVLASWNDSIEKDDASCQPAYKALALAWAGGQVIVVHTHS